MYIAIGEKGRALVVRKMKAVVICSVFSGRFNPKVIDLGINLLR